MFYRSSRIAPTTRRPGVVLLVVMAMLALFASLALSFVFYADSEAVSAGYSVTAQTNSAPDIDPELLADYFLSQLIYGTNNPYSAARGWDLARSMYGYNPAVLNYTPYNGTGRSALSYNVNFGATAVNNFNLVNYQEFQGAAVAATPDPYLNILRNPEYYGKTGDATFRYVGGANPPWTAYDTNSLFLAEMTADGTLILPSFARPWNANGIPTTSAAMRYATVFPDSPANNPSGTSWWNPQFVLPDAIGDPNGLQVKNYDNGPSMNDSNWMDWGFPIMTAPNGKRYKPLFAPLIVDMSNKLHLWAHGNNLGGTPLTALAPPGVSNQGFGSPDVNLNALPSIRIPIGSAAERGGRVTVTTLLPHGLKTGQSVMIAGVNVQGYDGTYTVTVPAGVPGLTTFTYPDASRGLAAAGNGFVYNTTALAELQALYTLRYGGASATPPWNAALTYAPGTTVTSAGVAYTCIQASTGQAPPNAAFWALATFPASRALAGLPSSVGTWYSTINANGLDQSAAAAPDATFGMSSTSPYAAFQTATSLTARGRVAGAGRHMVAYVPPSPFPLPYLPQAPQGIVQGMPITVNDGTANNAETVVVAAVNSAVNPPTFTATFTKAHNAGAAVIGGNPGFPAFLGWGNASALELAGNPLAFNLYLPGSPPLSMMHQEALLRWGGTNSPALTSGIFQRMPTTFSNMRSRNMVTLTNPYMDRVTSAPYLNFNRNSASTAVAPTEYGYYNGTIYPSLGMQEIQQITVTGTAGTYKLTIPGRAPTAAIAYNASAAVVQARLRATLAAGGTVTVTAQPAAAGTRVYTVSFAGNLSNVDVGQIVGAGNTGNPLPIVTVSTVQKGGRTLFQPPNFALAATAVIPNSDFTADWRSAVSQALRVDLSRPLRNYPAPAANGLIANTAVGSPFANAQGDRQQLAKDIYNALIRVTGARDPNVNALMQPTAADYQAARWLAQFAVNIVDYIDNDDYSTPFNWYPTPTPPATANNPEGWVFGIELPRLVLNEAYAQQEVTGTTGTVNIWAELYNPFMPTPAGSTYPLDGGSALLQQPGNIPYIIEIHNKDSAFIAAMQSPANPTGYAANPLSTMQGTANPWGTSATVPVLPGNGVQSALVIKPIAAAPGGAVFVAKGSTVTITTNGVHGLTAADNGKPVTVNVTGPGGAAYNGTFLISFFSPTKIQYVDASIAVAAPASGGGTITYGGNPNGPAGSYDQALGFYVIGPKSAAPLYGNPLRNPNLLATYLSPVVANTPTVAGQGMSFTNTSLNISPITAKANTTGVTHNGTTVTVNLTPATPLPATAAVGDQIAIQNVVTAAVVKGALGAPTPAVYNNTAANPTWTITSINAARTSFTFTYTGAGALPPATSESGSGATPATVSVQMPVTLLLRRLANPHLAFQNNPLVPNPPYNPYITVDSFDIPLANINPLPNPNTGSLGRFQPYGAATVPAYTAAVPTGTPNTFFSQNVPGATYNWLVHLDRPPVNPIELLHVSGCRPHELTQKFVTSGAGGAQQPYGHYAPWNPFNTSAPADPNALIYRALDQMSTHYMAGQVNGGRLQGNINLNTITEFEIFQALCDAHDATGQYPNAWFNQNDVAAIFINMILSRDGSQFLTGTTTSGNPSVTGLGTVPPGVTGVPATPTPGNLVFGLGIKAGTTVATVNAAANSFTLSQAPVASGTNILLYFVSPAGGVGTPFKSFSAATTVTNAGASQVSLNDTWFRPPPVPNPINPALPLFTPPSEANNPNAHPYWQSSLLQKIYNNITTTSNVFAVWWTVGYFEVVDETVKPARLGQEIGRSQNRHIRHRFFAIVDRSGLQLFNSTSKSIITAGTNKTVTLSAAITPASANGVPITLQPGMLLEIETPGNPLAEVVVVKTVPTATSFTADFVNAHGTGGVTYSIVCRGNPGPKTIYNPHDDPDVVLHMSVIK